MVSKKAIERGGRQARTKAPTNLGEIDRQTKEDKVMEERRWRSTTRLAAAAAADEKLKQRVAKSEVEAQIIREEGEKKKKGVGQDNDCARPFCFLELVEERRHSGEQCEQQGRHHQLRSTARHFDCNQQQQKGERAHARTDSTSVSSSKTSAPSPPQRAARSPAPPCLRVATARSCV
jgi:hypothetical protein